MLDGAAKLSVDVPRVFTASFEVFGSAPIVEQCYRIRNWHAVGLRHVDETTWCVQALRALVNHRGWPPDDTAAWLPWSMDAARRRELAAPDITTPGSAATRAATSRQRRWRCCAR